MGSTIPAMEGATVLILSLIGLTSGQGINQGNQCLVERVNHVCTGTPGPVIINKCEPLYNVSNLNTCLKRGRQDDQMTCFPCCEDPGKSIQHCSALRDGSEQPRWTFDINAVPEINPCEDTFVGQECIQRFRRAAGPPLQTVRDISSWQDCQAHCKQWYGCEWFTYIGLRNECKLKQARQGGRSGRSAAQRNLRVVAQMSGGQYYTSGSVLASDLTHPNCNCPTANDRYDGMTTTTQRSSWESWGWSWNPCPVGSRQTQRIFGRGVVQCCPVQAGTDGTPVCEF